jgi:hypothetical protein
MGHVVGRMNLMRSNWEQRRWKSRPVEVREVVGRIRQKRCIGRRLSRIGIESRALLDDRIERVLGLRVQKTR